MRDWIHVILGGSRKRWLAAIVVLAPFIILPAAYLAVHFNDGRLITRRPPPADYGFMNRPVTVLADALAGDGEERSGFALDLRHFDLTGLDLTQDGATLMDHASFDSRTRWPASESMPAEYDPQSVMELGKSPGLGVRELHQMGIDGRGVSIGIIDQPLLREHDEYSERLRHYEEVQLVGLLERKASMHGCAVTSLAAGKTVGVAPRAEIYYIGVSCSKHVIFYPLSDARDFQWSARAVRRLVEISRTLPREKRIRVISMSVGWSAEEAGYAEITQAVQEAEADGILVVSSSIGRYRGLSFHGLGRSPLADPRLPDSYQPGSWWEDRFRKTGGHNPPGRILVPMDSRTTAAPNGPHDYVFYREGGWSWSIPYIAGLYALAVQVRSDIEPEEFWALAAETGTHISWTDHEGEVFPLGPIVDPVRLIRAVRTGR